MITIVSASPNVKPRSTGRATKSDMPPSRNAPARMNSTPVIATSAAASASCAASPMLDSANTVAASTAADDDVDETIAKRLLPVSA